MATFNVAEPQQSDAQEFVPLATGEYPMIIKEASIGPSAFADDRGEFPEQVSITWQLDGTKAEQAEWEEAGYYPDQKVYQRMSSFFGNTKSGNPSKFYGLIQSFVEQGLLTPEFEIEHLVGIRQRVLVEKYTKQQGKNAGQPGNRVLAVTAPKRNGTKPAETPTANVSASQAMTRSNAVNLADADDIAGTQAKPVTPISDDTPITDLQLPPELHDLDKTMTVRDLRQYGEMVGAEAGGFYAKQDWSKLKIEDLVRLTAGAVRFVAGHKDDPNKDLFAE
jgi:hypothetical protein